MKKQRSTNNNSVIILALALFGASGPAKLTQPEIEGTLLHISQSSEDIEQKLAVIQKNFDFLKDFFSKDDAKKTLWRVRGNLDSTYGKLHENLCSYTKEISKHLERISEIAASYKTQNQDNHQVLLLAKKLEQQLNRSKSLAVQHARQTQSKNNSNTVEKKNSILDT